jgi:hypothetical protein
MLMLCHLVVVVVVVLLLLLILLHVACICYGATLAASHVSFVVLVLSFVLPFVLQMLPAAVVGIIGGDFAMVLQLLPLLLLLLLP